MGEMENLRKGNQNKFSHSPHRCKMSFLHLSIFTISPWLLTRSFSQQLHSSYIHGKISKVYQQSDIFIQSF